ncbi:hypothetical protein FSARC_11400 [Fusarium sarcochroum]|uniref:Ankyrin n=1 Tax=Fusarium sarcochroum TaxID=1208366 RepID=A0A8H4X149_9HYPO|nr:hypothetical protein FSARC_11400 [Fusarium sarcochroum]
MEALSAAASVIAVVQLATEVAKYCDNASEPWKIVAGYARKLYANDINGSDRNEGSFVRKDDTHDVDMWSDKIEALKSENAPLGRLFRALEAVKGKLNSEQEKGFRKIKIILKWPFDEKEVTKLVDAMQRERSLLHFALTHESTQLIKEIKETAGDGVEYLKTAQMSAHQIELLNWISPIDYAPQQSDNFGRRQSGTGEWLLGSDEYKSWLDTDRQVLFCPGIPGVGKTIMAFIVIDSLLELFHAVPGIGVAYIYCNFRRRNEQKASDLVANLLKQLCEGQPTLFGSVEDLYSRHNASQKRPSLVYIVIDALDECDTTEGTLMSFLRQIHDLQKAASTNIFATSRFEPEIMEMFHQTVQLDIRASEHDVRRYLDDEMVRLPPFVHKRPELQEEIKIKILESVQGMFLLARLHLDSLVGKRSPKAVRTILENLSSNSNASKAYDTAYNDAMERIQDQIADRASLGKEALMWISCAKRLLSPLELQHALAIESESQEFDEENLSEIEDILSACAGLVTVDENGNTIRLVHFTTQEYFERTQGHWFPRAASELTIKTMTYLSFDLSPDRSSSNFDESCLGLENVNDNQDDDKKNSNNNGLGAVFQHYPFCKYASMCWGEYALDAPEMIGAVKEFLASERNVRTAVLVRHRETDDISDLKTTGLHEATLFGLEGATEWMLQRHSIGSTDSSGMSALDLACFMGHLPVVKLLTTNGTTFHGTPLTHAASEGHYAIVAYLLQHGAPLEPEAIAAAVSSRDPEPLARLLLDRGADVNVPDAYGVPPLHWAVCQKPKSLIQLLLDYGADINLPEADGDFPLHYAVYKNDKPLIQLLLDYGADVNLSDVNGNTPLYLSLAQDDDHLVPVLLEHGAKVAVENKRRETSFSFAVSKYLLFLAWPALVLDSSFTLQNLEDLMPLGTEWDYEPLLRLLSSYTDETSRHTEGFEQSVYDAALEAIEPVVRAILDPGATVYLQDERKGSLIARTDTHEGSRSARMLLKHGTMAELRKELAVTLLVCSLRISEMLSGRYLSPEDDVERDAHFLNLVRSHQKRLDQILLQGDEALESFDNHNGKALKVIVRHGEKRFWELRRKFNNGDETSANNYAPSGDPTRLLLSFELVDTGAPLAYMGC